MRQKTRIVRSSALVALGISGAIFGCSAGDEATSGGQVLGGQTAVGSAAVPSTGAAPSRAAGPSTGVSASNGTVLSSTAASPSNLNVQRDRIRRVHGVAATGRTLDEAAETFRQSSVAALGLERDELLPARLKGAALSKASGTAARANGVGLMHDPVTGKPKFRLYSYAQQRDGIPVFRASLRTLVR